MSCFFKGLPQRPWRMTAAVIGNLLIKFVGLEDIYKVTCVVSAPGPLFFPHPTFPGISHFFKPDL